MIDGTLVHEITQSLPYSTYIVRAIGFGCRPRTIKFEIISEDARIILNSTYDLEELSNVINEFLAEENKSKYNGE